jgi:hypothetical protein
VTAATTVAAIRRERCRDTLFLPGGERCLRAT